MSEQASQPGRIYQAPMRIESSVTSISWIPSEAMAGLPRCPSRRASPTTTSRRPRSIEDLDALRATRAVPLRQPPVGLGRGGRRPHRRPRPGRRRADRLHHAAARARSRSPSRPSRCPTCSPSPGERTEVTFVQTAGGRTGVPAPRRVRRAPSSSSRLRWPGPRSRSPSAPTAVVPLAGASSFPRHWVYDTTASCPQVGDDRLRELVPPRLRQAQPLGRPGLAGAHHRGGVGPGAPALGAHAGRRQAQDPRP